MQRYKIELPESVKTKIRDQALFIAKDKPPVALQWYEHIFDQIDSLEFSPKRCSIAPESRYIDFEVRHLISGNYRILFRIDGQTVVVLDFKSGKQSKPE